MDRRATGAVAGLAGRWSLPVGEPFQAGRQCSWTAPATGPDGTELVVKVGFRFLGGEERDEAAGLRANFIDQSLAAATCI